MTSQLGFFDLEDRLSALSAAGIHLERLSAALNTLVVKKMPLGNVQFGGRRPEAFHSGPFLCAWGIGFP